MGGEAGGLKPENGRSAQRASEARDELTGQERRSGKGRESYGVELAGEGQSSQVKDRCSRSRSCCCSCRPRSATA